jgi:L-alanine-DL-glutamate epimerase-like enolase superfamily enzyme
MRLTVREECWPLAGTFTISRGSRTEARVVTVALEAGDGHGWGECVPYARYGESVESVIAQIEALRPQLEGGMSRDDLARALEPGAARNAVDCALWDLEAKRSGTPVWQLAGLGEPEPLTTAYTLSLGEPEAMGAAASANAHRPLLKIKLGGAGDIERVRAVRTGAPDSRLIVDANEAWSPDMLDANLAAMADLGVSLIEQPLPAGHDDALEGIDRPVPICADESCHDRASLSALTGRYDVINIKLDKTGGLTEALLLAEAAKAAGLRLMVGCMVGTSLAMAPAMLVGGMAEFVDLDGPLLMAEDRQPGIHFQGSLMDPAPANLWG